jgi:hypothetical protein
MDIKKYPEYLQHYFEAEADKLINSMILSTGKPEIEWDALDWKIAARVLAKEFIAQNKELHVFTKVGNHLADEFGRRKAQDKDRIANRKDQVDMRDFQNTVKMFIDDYETKADAIRDLRIKPQFSDYSDKTLREWLKPVWDKPTRNGRPKKTM